MCNQAMLNLGVEKGDGLRTELSLIKQYTVGKQVYFKILTRLDHGIFKDAAVSKHHWSCLVLAK